MNKIDDSRDSILARIRNNKPEARASVEIPVFTVAGDPLRNFVGHLRGFDGDYRLFATRDDAVAWLQQNVVSGKGCIVSAADGVTGNKAIGDFDTPAAMHTIDTCIAEARLGVGETGSLLVDETCLGNPAAALFSTNLYLLIDRTKILAGLQEAYSSVNMADHQYSAFFSGPSATADIEAVHITGAQGQISLTALIYNCTQADMSADADVPASTPMAPAIKLKRESNPQTGTDSI